MPKRRRAARTVTADSPIPKTRLERFLERAAANDRAVQRRLAAGRAWDGRAWVKTKREHGNTGGLDDTDTDAA